MSPKPLQVTEGPFWPERDAFLALTVNETKAQDIVENSLLLLQDQLSEILEELDASSSQHRTLKKVILDVGNIILNDFDEAHFIGEVSAVETGLIERLTNKLANSYL